MGAPTEKGAQLQSAFLSSSPLLPQKAGRAASPACFPGGTSDWAGFVHTLGLLWSLRRLKEAGRFRFEKVHPLPVADKGTRSGASSSSLSGEGRPARLSRAAPQGQAKGTQPDVFPLLPAGTSGRGRPRALALVLSSVRWWGAQEIPLLSLIASFWVGAGQRVQRRRPGGGSE